MDSATMDNSNEKNVLQRKTDSAPILIAIVVGAVLFLCYIILKRRSTRRRDFLLTGLCESGKSAIFMQMLHKKIPETLTSIKENIGVYRSGRMSGRLVDIPGHYRVRGKLFDQYKRTAKGVIFVVDAVQIQKEIRDVADAFFTILSDKSTLSCPFLVLCNKQDMTTAKSAQIVKAILEKEMNIVRNTRNSKLQSLGDDSALQMSYLGKEGKDFEFTQLPQNVQFFECSAKENQLNHLTDWIDRML